SLDDRGLAHARLADQHRVVLGAALQDLDHAANLVVAADHRVELARARPLGQIERVFLQRLAAPFGFLAADRLTAAHRLDRLVDRLLTAAVFLQQAAGLALVLGEREQKELRGDELVAALLRFLVGQIQQAVQLARDLHLPAVALHLRQTRHRLLGRLPQPRTLTPARDRSDALPPSSWSSRAASRCSGSMNGLSCPKATLWASPSASWNLVVSLSIRILP